MVSLILFEEKSVIYVDNLEIDSGYIDRYMIGHSPQPSLDNGL